MHRPRPELAMPFRDTLPAEARAWTWRMTKHIMLTLPDTQGQYTAFEEFVCEAQRIRAHNVAWYCVEGSKHV